MAAAPPPADQAAEILQKLNLDSDSKTKAAGNEKKYSSVNSGILANGLSKPFCPDFVDPSFYLPDEYSSTYYYGSEWENYSYSSNDGVKMPLGAYNNNGSLVYPQGYSYAPFYEHYQYPSSYYQSSTPSSGVETANVNYSASNAGGNGLNMPRPVRPNYQNSTWKNSSVLSDGKSKYIPSSHGNTYYNGRNQSLYPFSHLTGMQQTRPAPGMNKSGFMDRMYNQYVNMFMTSAGYGLSSYNRKLSGRGWIGNDGRFKARERGNGCFNHENAYDGLNELNRGPRAKGGFKNQGELEQVNLAMKGQHTQLNGANNEEKLSPILNKDQYNKEDFPEVYKDARFFIIKSYSEDDVHKSIKYGVWASTPNGNKKLDAAYREAQEVSGGCPTFLLFSVNASGQFVGVAEMTNAVDFSNSVEYWQQDKWTGCFSVKWHIVKDIPNSLLKHIILANNENKPVTNSRDTQEVKLEQGIEILKIIKSHSSKTCILDDFGFYESRQKVILEKKAKQQLIKERIAIDNKERNESTAKACIPKSVDVATVLVEDSSVVLNNAVVETVKVNVGC
ncbi:YTH domain-containing protein ECT4-like [Impatiens glandulifera]|uniref:YTH domain-containing protein ECT4-like n=1 Tax=Impatiens glandulifera TaxID=253017 RepID=UPI001FB0A7FE|nr:YTH domain-containing protein ECT4-like [Impatiens glandulifera]